ncbi:hypothetical protein EIN_486910 [Entamoeba invadens IP1]|uniref:PITH domain-containing protein n=1 Tax=Entamoeba invadens IP1 TaxID=370355 RepID=A0A0A1U4X7_ENTIV|nr:hypothetical protein EIN_486910 [Entamoeba invadens IP1]ELP89229.1 hypothetical protein EIN_486910 [Entamoeba invadens IP1]|eukprot:XP_004256000.1 hypothetical protein EIN_486910 [Entamoeba invadens IP1]
MATTSGDKFVSLNESIDKKDFEILNTKTKETIKVLKGKETITSEVDEQLLIHISFTQTVNLRTLLFQSPKSETAPKEILIFTNRNDISFEDAESVKPTQIISINQNEIGKQVAVKPFLFNNVHALTIFVKSNFAGTKVTQIKKFELFGQTKKTTNMSDFKPVCCCCCQQQQMK